MQNTADHATVVHPIFTAHVRWQVRRDMPPLLVAQPKQVAPHPIYLPNHEATESPTDSDDNDFIGLRP
jgi:hypothetical protein